MIHLVIENVGPIVKADLSFKKYNFFIGPQSSGKSTIAKIFSTCSWIEKEVATTLNEKVVADGSQFKRLVEDFHKMSGYFTRASVVKYESESISLSYIDQELVVVMNPSLNYSRQKTSYIPSDRNMVSVPGLQSLELGATSLRSFLFDWFTARNSYPSSQKAEILDLGVSYYYESQEQTLKDRIEHTNGKTYQIPLYCASSGLQSVIPLVLMLRYFSEDYYHDEAFRTSFDDNERNRMLRERLIDRLVIERLYPGFQKSDRPSLLREINDKLAEYESDYIAAMTHFDQKYKQITTPVATRFIVEEPEQNLFPYTQIQLVEYLLQICKGGRVHSMTVTTHSPYIVNALNVLLLRHYKDNDKLGIDPDDLSVYSVQDGFVLDQVKENTKTGYRSVNVDDLFDAMNQMYTEYRELKRM